MNHETPKKKRRGRRTLSPAERLELKKDLYRILENEKRKKSQQRIQEDLIQNCGWEEHHFWDNDNLGRALSSLIKEGRVAAYADYSEAIDYYYRKPNTSQQ